MVDTVNHAVKAYFHTPNITEIIVGAHCLPTQNTQRQRSTA